MPQNINSLINYYKSYGYDDQTAQLYAILGVPIVGQFGENRLPSIPYMEMPRLQPEIMPSGIAPTPKATKPFVPAPKSTLQQLMEGAETGTAWAGGYGPAVETRGLQGQTPAGLLGALGTAAARGAAGGYQGGKSFEAGLQGAGRGFMSTGGGILGTTVSDAIMQAAGIPRAPAMPYSATNQFFESILGPKAGPVAKQVAQMGLSYGVPYGGFAPSIIDLLDAMAKGKNISRSLATIPTSLVSMIPGIGQIPGVSPFIQGLMANPLASAIQTIGELTGLATTKAPEQMKTASWVSPGTLSQMSTKQIQDLLQSKTIPSDIMKTGYTPSTPDIMRTGYTPPAFDLNLAAYTPAPYSPPDLTTIDITQTLGNIAREREAEQAAERAALEKATFDINMADYSPPDRNHDTDGWGGVGEGWGGM